MPVKKVFVVAAKRTAIGSFGGKLAGLSAPFLASEAIKACLLQSNLPSDAIDEVFIGNVLSANLGQAPARQAAILAGLSHSTPCTGVNKVCASGSKAIALGFNSILAGENELVLVGGMESMSNVPFYLENHRFGNKLGHHNLVDGLIKDGLWDVYNNMHMGSAAEKTAKVMNITREEQDEFAVRSYQLSAKASESGAFKNEMLSLKIIKGKQEFLVDEDEEFKNVVFEKIPSLRPVFNSAGTITAANASTINDGACALILADEKAVQEFGLKPLAEILATSDAATEPIDFSIAPSLAVKKLMNKVNFKSNDVQLWEINEAFSSVVLANQKLLGLDIENVNVNGGAVSLGHPIGCSGARILTSLIYALHQKSKEIGVSSICNGGGGATAIAIKAV
ncbi:MAG: thiolase family protein [Cytophagales bacterium]